MRKTAPFQIMMQSPAGSPLSIEWQPLDNLKIDFDYQRLIDSREGQDSVKRIGLKWDWRLCGLLMVARRDGELFVIDGQHRLEAARMRGDIPYLPCVVANFDSQEQEAECFVAINTRRRSLSPVALFKAAVAGGDREAASLARILASVGLGLTRCADHRHWRVDEINYIQQLRSFYHRYGDEVTVRALTVIAEGFPGQYRRFGSALFAAAGSIVAGRGCDDDLLIGVLRGQDGQAWFRDFQHEVLVAGCTIRQASTAVVMRAYQEAAAE